MLQRVSRTETGEIADTLRHVTVADSEARLRVAFPTLKIDTDNDI